MNDEQKQMEEFFETHSYAGIAEGAWYYAPELGDEVEEADVAAFAEEGVWRTIRGRAVFIREGEEVGEAIKRSLARGRGSNKKPRAEHAKQLVQDVLAEQGVDKLKVTFKSGRTKDNVGNFHGSMAGQYNPKTNSFTFYPDVLALYGDKATRTVALHEASHAKFERAARSSSVKDFLSKNVDALQRDDGTTAYAKAHWKEFRKKEGLYSDLFGKSTRNDKFIAGMRRLAVDESLAEMRAHGKIKGVYVKLDKLISG